MEEGKHLFVPELGAFGEPLTSVAEAHDLLIDLKVLLKEYYTATFTEDGNALLMKFNNGQRFKLTLEEC